MTFNYTDTLERYYTLNPRRILHVHGKAIIPESSIILGHAIEPSAFEKKPVEPPKGLTTEQLEEWQEVQGDKYSYSVDMAEQELRAFYYELHKPTKEIIHQNRHFFQHLGDISTVHVLGHSLARVDLPYIAEVLRSIDRNSVRWNVSYFGESERARHMETLTSLGVSAANITPIVLGDLRRKPPTLFA